jgi:hypothetical protein
MVGESVDQRYPRYQIRLPLLHKLGPPDLGVEVGWTRNLSEGGACVELLRRLQPSTPVWLRLQADSGPIEVEGWVAWTRADAAQGRAFVHGVAFRTMLPPQRRLLHELLDAKGRVRESGVRVRLDLPVSCQREGAAGSPLQGRTVDFSRGGLLLHVPERLSPGTSVEVALHTPQGTLAAKGVVAWAAPLSRGESGCPIQHGLRFTSLGWSTPLVLGLVLADPVRGK